MGRNADKTNNSGLAIHTEPAHVLVLCFEGDAWNIKSAITAGATPDSYVSVNAFRTRLDIMTHLAKAKKWSIIENDAFESEGITYNAYRSHATCLFICSAVTKERSRHDYQYSGIDFAKGLLPETPRLILYSYGDHHIEQNCLPAFPNESDLTADFKNQTYHMKRMVGHCDKNDPKTSALVKLVSTIINPEATLDLTKYLEILSSHSNNG